MKLHFGSLMVCTKMWYGYISSRRTLRLVLSLDAPCTLRRSCLYSISENYFLGKINPILCKLASFCKKTWPKIGGKSQLLAKLFWLKIGWNESINMQMAYVIKTYLIYFFIYNWKILLPSQNTSRKRDFVNLFLWTWIRNFHFTIFRYTSLGYTIFW